MNLPRFKKYITEIKDYQHDILHPPEDHLLQHEDTLTGDPDHFAHAHNTLARYYHHLNILGPQSTRFHMRARESGLVHAPEGYIRPAVFHPETGQQVSPEKLVHPKFTMLPNPIDLGFKTATLGREYLTHLRNADKQANQRIINLASPNLNLSPKFRLHHILGLSTISDHIKELADSHVIGIQQTLKQPHLIAQRGSGGEVALEELSVPRMKAIHHKLREGLYNPASLVHPDERFEVRNNENDFRTVHTISSIPEHQASDAYKARAAEAEGRVKDIEDHEHEEKESKRPQD